MLAKKESYSLEHLPQKRSLKLETCNTDDEKIDLPKRGCNQTCKAFLTLFYLTLQSIFSQIEAIIVRTLAYISVCQLSLIQFLAIFAFALPVAILCNTDMFGGKKNWFLLTFRALLEATGLLLHMASFRYLQLVEVSIIRCTRPFLTAILARMLLKESFGKVQTITLLITICGVLLSLRLPKKFDSIIRTNFDIYFVLGLIMSVGSVLCLSLSGVTTRKLKKIHFSILLLYFSYIGAIENAVLNATVYPLVSIDCGWHQFFAILFGISAVFASSLITLAFQLEPPGLVTVQKSSLEVLVAVIFQIIFYSEYPDVYVISGVCVVIASLSIIGVKNWIHLMPESSKTRQKLNWILT